MFARVTLGQFKADKLDEALTLYRQSILPATRQSRGFRGVLVLTDRQAGRAIAVSLWETESDRSASESSSGYYQDALRRLASYFAVPPTTEPHEVSVGTAIEAGAKFARVTTTKVKPAALEEGRSFVQDTLVPLAKQQRGFKGYLWLINGEAGRGMGLSLWETEADMTASEAGSGYLPDMIEKARSFMEGQPSFEHYEVAVGG